MYARKVGVPRPAKGDSPTAAVAALRQATIAAIDVNPVTTFVGNDDWDNMKYISTLDVN